MKPLSSQAEFPAGRTCLPQDYYLDADVVAIARDLLGKCLLTRIDGVLTAGMITETEAYRAPDDRACHAWNNRRTARTEVMFAAGGVAYVYLCYGMHTLFNVVTGPEDSAHAVLIRSIQPLHGLETMLQRRERDQVSPQLCCGPGVMSRSLGIRLEHNGTMLFDPQSPVRIYESDPGFDPHKIRATRRVGVESAGSCAQRLWRFTLVGNPWISHPRHA